MGPLEYQMLSHVEFMKGISCITACDFAFSHDSFHYIITGILITNQVSLQQCY